MKEESLDTIIKRKFRHLSDQQLIDRANRALDFGWDDEGYEIERRRRECGLNCEMQGNRIVILAQGS